jgi:hypothetical protein
MVSMNVGLRRLVKKILIAILLVIGCSCRSNRPQLAMRYEYEPPVAGATFTIRHIVANSGEQELTVCTLPECVDYEWDFCIPIAESPLADIPEDNAGIVMVGIFGCTTCSNQFRQLRAGNTFVLEDKVLNVPESATQLIYHARFHPRRTGKDIGLSAWTGEVDGGEIRIPIMRSPTR